MLYMFLFCLDKVSMANHGPKNEVSNFFDVLLTVHLSIILDNDQPDTNLLYFTIRLL